MATLERRHAARIETVFQFNNGAAINVIDDLLLDNHITISGHLVLSLGLACAGVLGGDDEDRGGGV